MMNHGTARENDAQGGHIVMDLTTGEEFTRDLVTPVPLTDTAKDIVEAMAVSQGITELKITNKNGDTLAHHDWIARVDYDAINDPTENENGIEDIEKQQIDNFF